MNVLKFGASAGSRSRQIGLDASRPSRRRVSNILFGGCVLAASLAAATIAVIWNGHRAATAEWRERISGLADMIGAHAKQTVESSDEILLAVVKNIDSLQIGSADELREKLATQDTHASLASRIRGAPHIEMMAVIDRNGDVISNSLKPVPPYPFSQWSRLKGPILDDNVDRIFSDLFQPVISNPNELVIGLGRKFFSPSGEFLGLVGVAMRSRHFSDFYDSLPMTDGYRVKLLNQDGIELAGSPAHEVALGQKTRIREFDTELRDKDHAVFVTRSPSSASAGDRSPRLVAMRRIPEISMVATASISSGIYLSQWWWNATFFLIGGCFVTLASVFLTFAARRLFEEMDAARAAAVAHAGAKTRFLSAMSHEIRTPLNAISGSAELMLDHPLPNDVRKFASVIQRSSKHLLLLVTDILEFARLEAGKHRFEAVPFELSRVLDTIMDIAGSLPGAEKLCIRLIVNDATPPFLRGDYGVMTQVLLNLLSNSVKFTENGYVELIVSFDHENSMLVLDVSDTGCGIPPIHQEEIFKPFERGRAAGSGIEGTGLGLTIAKHLVESAGGTMRLRTADGSGSTFTVELPMSATSPDAARASVGIPPNATQASPSLRVLVAEDVAANRMVIESLLRKHGHSVHLSANGREALEAARKWRFDAVLMDFQMPEMDGIEATRAIRNLPGSAGSLLIIGMTAFVEPEQHAAMLAAGMDLCLTKPLQTPDLLAALGRTSGRSTVKRQQPAGAEVAFITEKKLQGLFLADVRAGRDELVSCLDDHARSLRAIHKLHGLFAMFDKPRLAQLAADAERSRQRAEAQRLLDAVDDLLSSAD